MNVRGYCLPRLSIPSRGGRRAATSRCVSCRDHATAVRLQRSDRIRSVPRERSSGIPVPRRAQPTGVHHGRRIASRHAGADQGTLQERMPDRRWSRSRRAAPSTTRTSRARSRPAGRSQSRACILRPAAPGSNCAPATCCSEALVACAGVTLKAVSTALDITIKSGSVSAEGDLDFRGTLGVAKDAPVGFARIRLSFRGGDRRAAGQARPASQTHRALLRGLPDHKCGLADRCARGADVDRGMVRS